LILELNPDTVRIERENNEPIFYGDAVQENILSHVGIHKARVAVIAISDPLATKRIVVNIRSITNKAFIIVRTRFIQEMEENFKLGADEVIPEEFETAIEIFIRVLTKYLIPQDEIENFVRGIRSDNYDMLRSLPSASSSSSFRGLDLPDVEVATLTVHRHKKSVVGKTLLDSGLRHRFGVTIVGIKRGETIINDIKADTEMQQHDILYVFGKSEDILAFNDKIKI